MKMSHILILIIAFWIAVMLAVLLELSDLRVVNKELKNAIDENTKVLKMGNEMGNKVMDKMK